MSNLRFYNIEKLQTGMTIKLDDNAATHAIRVMRLTIGDNIKLFDGGGLDYLCELISIKKGEVLVNVLTNEPVTNESPLNITLLQGISSGDRMDLTIQKSVELGVTKIVPIKTSRSMVKLSKERAEKRLVHWRKIIISACEQSGRSRIPLILAPIGLTEWLASNPAKNYTRIILDPLAKLRLKTLSKPNDCIELLVGAEGGLSREEINLASEHGFTGVQLGKRILRTETAPLAAIATMQTLWGDF